jgi:preprotein translocase subunit SecB
MRLPTAENEVFDGLVELTGRFVATQEVKPERAALFARMSALYLLWPYARTILDEAARHAGVEASPLPLLARPGENLLLVPQVDTDG